MPNLKAKKRTCCSKGAARMGESVRSHDNFGQPVSLTYQGSTEFQTMPGGLLSMMASLIILAYGLMKLKHMVTYSDWTLL